jgi:hypothetical protein
VQVYNRNTFPNVDASALAAFVSPSSPEVLQYAKSLTGIARSRRQTGINQNLQFSIYLFEGLRSGGVGIRADVADVREIQFPAQTLAYKSGTVTDLGLLFAASLESAGIRAAYIPLASTTLSTGASTTLSVQDFIVAVSLGIGETAAASQFNGMDRLLVIDDEVWLPLSCAHFEEGFSASWALAVKALDAVFAAEETVEFIIVEDAWASYPPAPFPALGARTAQVEQNAVSSAADKALQAYIQSELSPKLQAVNAEIRRAPTAALYNQQGNLYLRSGMMSEAKAAYEKAASTGSAGGAVNRGSLALQEKDYATAERWFNQALRLQADYAPALNGLEQVKNK